MSSLFNLNNDAFASFALYGSLALGKTVLMSMLTVRERMRYQAMPSLEDAQHLAPNNLEKQKMMMAPNENVERVRRAHLNDLENVVPFVLLGLIYVATDPKPSIALWHYRIFLASRILHTFIYVKGIRQPFRAIAFAAGFSTLASMAAQTIMATYKYF